METKFTKNLKVVYPEINNPNSFSLVDNDGFCHANVYGANGTTEEMEESEANAILFAAASELLESAIDMVNAGNEIDWEAAESIAIDKLHKAIKKATKI